MTDKPDNPSAFPNVDNHPSYDYPLHGLVMTLRDYFAGQALAGMTAHSSADYSPLGGGAARIFAADAYAIADEMLATRVA